MDDLIGTKEACAVLGVCYDTLKRLIDEGVVHTATPANPLLKRPRRFTFYRKDLEGLLGGQQEEKAA